MWDVSTSDDLPRSTGQGAEAELQRSTPAPSRSTKASRRLTTVPLCSPRAFATLHVTAANGADQRVVTRSTVSTQWTLFTWSAAQRHGSSMITSIACGRLARPFDTRISLELRIAVEDRSPMQPSRVLSSSKARTTATQKRHPLLTRQAADNPCDLRGETARKIPVVGFCFGGDAVLFLRQHHENDFDRETGSRSICPTVWIWLPS